MGEGLRWEIWLVVLDLLRVVSTTNVQDKLCGELEFEGLNSEDKLINVTENSFVNLTFHLKTAGCQPLVDTIRVKVSYQDNGLVTDICNVFFHPHCDVTISSSPCHCLNSCCAQWSMKVSRSDSRVYTWTWFPFKDWDSKKQRDIGIHVIATSNTSDNKMLLIFSPVCVIVVGSSIALCIFWRRTKSKAEVNVDDNEDFSSEFDSVSDDFVNIENEQSPEETYDHLSTYRDVSQSRV